MKPQVVLSALAFVLAAGALAMSAVAWSVASANAPADASDAKTAFQRAPGERGRSPSRSSAAGLERRVAEVEADLEVLRAELRARRRGGRTEQGRAGTALAGQGRPQPILEGEEDPPSAEASDVVAEALASDPEVASRIDSLVEEKLQADRDERWRRREERAAERDRERLDRFVAAQELNDGQAETLAALIDAERAQIMTLMKSARETMDWRTARDQMQAIRTETDGNLSSVLDDEQLEGWQAVREEQSSFWRGGRRGRRGSSSDDKDR